MGETMGNAKSGLILSFIGTPLSFSFHGRDALWWLLCRDMRLFGGDVV